MSAARVQHPAPDFKGTAVVDGTFEGASFPGFHSALANISSRDLSQGLPGQVADSRLHPDGVDLRLVRIPSVRPTRRS
jgi:hypothetical protein